jgi:hypothetical protein
LKQHLDLSARTSTRPQNDLDSKFVVGVNHTYDGSTDESFLLELDEANLGEYKFAVVMSCADRNLDTIFRSERPDMTTVRSLSKQIAEAVGHCHEMEVRVD